MPYIIDMGYVVVLFFVLLFMYKLWLRTRLFVHGLEYPKYSHLYYSLLLIKKKKTMFFIILTKNVFQNSCIFNSLTRKTIIPEAPSH